MLSMLVGVPGHPGVGVLVPVVQALHPLKGNVTIHSLRTVASLARVLKSATKYALLK